MNGLIFSQPDFSVKPAGGRVQADSLFACFSGMRVLLDKETLQLPTSEQIPHEQIEVEPFELAHTNERTIFSPHPFTGVEIPETEQLAYFSINIFRSLPFDTAALITTSWHLWNWYQNHRFCGRCGKLLEPASGERALHCPSCDHMFFPVIMPAVITAITCGDRILLARNANSPFANYALVAGYVEVGETLEHAVRREVLEEVGLHVKNLRYLGDQPWGISGSHMFAFHAEADDQQTIVIQKAELSDARWFDRKELEPRGHMVSIANELIERFRVGTL